MKKILIASICTSLLVGCGSEPQTQEAEIKAEAVAEIKSSGFDLADFDNSIRAQDDFYRFTSGSWIDKKVIPDDRSSYNSFTALFEENQKQMLAIIKNAAADKDAEMGSNNQKIGALYNSYMDEEKIESLGMSPLQPELDKIDAINNKDQLASYFAYAKKIGVITPLSVGVSQDRKNSTQYITSISQSGLGLPDRDYYFDESRAEIRAKYVEFIEILITAAGSKDVPETAARIMALETALAEVQWTRVQRRDANATYNKMSKAEFAKLIPAFNWDNYLASAEFDVDDFVINHPSYFEGMNKVYEQTPVDVWKEYLRFSLVNTYASSLNKDIVQANFDFFRGTLSGVKEMRPRWKNGVNLINGSIGFMLGKVYVDKHFSPLAKSRMDELVKNLTSAFEISITELTWMGEETKVKAKEKLGSFTKKIGYPDEWQDYSALQFEEDDLIGNKMRISQYNYERNINRLGQPVDRGEWFMSPQTINAYYNPPMNEIVFPAAILQPPFFNLEADDAVNYGAIGAVIGHEYGHGFDDQGRKYDQKGNLSDWWTKSDAEQFKVRADMLTEQYNQFEVLDDVHVNGHLTLGENIGDLGGLTIAYKAYKLSLNGKEAPIIDGFTGEQRFFIGWSQVWRSKSREAELKRLITIDPHSPNRYRVIGVLTNMPEFMKAFDVKPGDKMYRADEERVKIW